MCYSYMLSNYVTTITTLLLFLVFVDSLVVYVYKPEIYLIKLENLKTKAHIHKLDSNSTSTRTYRISSYNYLTVPDYLEVRSSRIHRHECSWRKLQ